MSASSFCALFVVFAALWSLVRSCAEIKNCVPAPLQIHVIASPVGVSHFRFVGGDGSLVSAGVKGLVRFSVVAVSDMMLAEGPWCCS